MNVGVVKKHCTPSKKTVYPKNVLMVASNSVKSQTCFVRENPKSTLYTKLIEVSTHAEIPQHTLLNAKAIKTILLSTEADKSFRKNHWT